MYVFNPNNQMNKIKYDKPLQIGKLFSNAIFVLKFISKYIIRNVIVDIIRITVASQNPNRNGLPINLTDVISTKFLSCLIALDSDILFLLA